MDAKMTDKRVVRETRLRTLIRQNGRSPLTWLFSILITHAATNSWEFVAIINIPIIVFAVISGYFWERGWLRVKWGIEK